MIRALIFAPLAAAAVIVTPLFSYNQPPGFASGTILAVIIASMCYAAEAVLVLPVMLLWPAARRPSLLIAAVWGTVAACVACLAVHRPQLSVFVGYGAAGAVAGLVYAFVVSRTTALDQTAKLKAVLLCLVLASTTLQLNKPPTAEVKAAAIAALPRFEDYPNAVAFSGRPAPVLLKSARYGRTYQTRLREGAQTGPNFAGAFTVVTWGCGSSCQVTVIIDARTGALSQQVLRTTNGVEFRRDSRLLVADPIHPGDPPLETCAACGIPAAYEWSAESFKPVGRGPHPHWVLDLP